MTTSRTLPGTVKEQAVAGFGQAVSGYDEGSTEFFKDMGARLVNLAGVHAGAHVLDVGCGKGPVTIPAARLAGEGGCVHAIDLARPMLDTAAALARQSGLGNVTVARGDAEDPPFAAGTFDVILAGFLIQLLPRPAHAVQRWRALLKPGGTLSFSWGLAQDPRWMPVMAALDAHVPPGMSRFEAFFRRPPFDGTGHVDQMLTEAGYQAVQTVIHQVDTWFAPASLEVAMSANCLQVYQKPVPYNRFSHTLSEAYLRSMSEAVPRYTTAPSPSWQSSHHRLPASPS